MASNSKRPFPQYSDEEEEGDRSLVRGSKRSRLWLRRSREVTAECLLPQLEPLLRRVVQEEVQKLLLNYVQPVARPFTNRSQEVVRFHLHFQARLPGTLFTGRKIKAEDDMSIKLVMKYADSDNIVTSGLLSSTKIKIVVLNADFGGEGREDWTMEEFTSHIVSQRDGKRPLLTGGLSRLKEGVACVVDATFTDNSSWTRSGKFRLGAMVSESSFPAGRIREAISEAFKVKDCRVESNQKYGPLSLKDEVWCLKKIAKEGAFHKKLVNAGIKTVQDFLRRSILDPKSLRNILGKGMSKEMWNTTLKHASGCTLDENRYYFSAEHGLILVFNSIYELVGVKINGHYRPLADLIDSQKNLVNQYKEIAYKNQANIDMLPKSSPRILPMMDVTSISGSSLCNLQIADHPATYHGELSNIVASHDQPSTPNHEFLDEVSKPKDSSTGHRSESVHLLASFRNQGCPRVSGSPY